MRYNEVIESLDDSDSDMFGRSTRVQSNLDELNNPLSDFGIKTSEYEEAWAFLDELRQKMSMVSEPVWNAAQAAYEKVRLDPALEKLVDAVASDTLRPESNRFEQRLYDALSDGQQRYGTEPRPALEAIGDLCRWMHRLVDRAEEEEWDKDVNESDASDDDLFGGTNHPHGKEIAQDLELWLRRRQSGSRRPIGLMQAEYVENIIAGFNQSFLAGVKAWQQGAAFVSDIKYNIREYLENSMGVDLANQALDESESDEELFGAGGQKSYVVVSPDDEILGDYDTVAQAIERARKEIPLYYEDGWGDGDFVTIYKHRGDNEDPSTGDPVAKFPITDDPIDENDESDDDLFGNKRKDVHDLSDYSDGEAYDETQVSDEIKSGDILKLSNGRWAVLVVYEPVMVVGKSESMPSLASGYSWNEIEDGKFAAPAAKALMLSKKHSIEESDDDMFSTGPRISPRMSLVLRTMAQEMEDTTHRAWQIYKMFEKQGYVTGAAAIRDLPVDEKSFILKNCFKPAVANHLLKSMSNKSSPPASAIADQMAQGIERCTKNVELINKIADAFNGNDIKHAIQGTMYSAVADDIHNWLADRDPRLATELDAMIERYQEEDEDF